MASRSLVSAIEQPIPAGVVGLGLMGTSIATCLVAAGHRVVAIDKDAARRRNLKRRVSVLLRDMRREKLVATDPASVLKNLSTSDDFSALRDCGLVIESIFENLSEKRDVLRKIEDVVSPEALIGSNTSALPVTELQRGARHPKRILGIHWGEPAHILAMKPISGMRRRSCGLQVYGGKSRLWSAAMFEASLPIESCTR